MSEDSNRRKLVFQEKYKKAIDDIIDGAKQLSKGNKLFSRHKKEPLTPDEILDASAKLEAEKKAEQISAFLEEEVFGTITRLEGRVQELENKLSALSAASTSSTPGV